MTPSQIRALVAEYVNATLETVEEYSLTHTRTDSEREATSLAITDQLDDSTSELLNNDFHRIATTADDLLTKHGLTVERDSFDWKRLCHGLLVGLQTALQAELRHVEGDFTPQAHNNRTANGKAETLIVSKRFSEISALYFAEHKRAPRTDGQIKSAFARFLAAIGGDRPVKSVGPATTNKHLHNLAHLFTWASGQGFVQEDFQPVKGLLINKRVARKEAKARKPFTDAQLASILQHPEFLKQKTGPNPERYWLVLSLLLSGARREEIAQLRTEDIGEERGVWFFNITDEQDSQSIKNQESRRRVPIHKDLERLGFLRYVQGMRSSQAPLRAKERRDSQELRLFPKAKKGGNGYGDATGKWFSRLLRQHLQITGHAYVLHSLRHTVITRLSGAGVPENVAEMLVGHASDTVHGQVYVNRESIPLSMLKTQLERLDYGVALKHLFE